MKFKIKKYHVTFDHGEMCMQDWKEDLGIIYAPSKEVARIFGFIKLFKLPPIGRVWRYYRVSFIIKEI